MWGIRFGAGGWRGLPAIAKTTMVDGGGGVFPA